MRAIKRMDATQKPTMVIGWAILKGSLRAIFRSKDKLAIKAQAREAALTAMSHEGSCMSMPCSSVPPGGIFTLQFSTRAQMLNAFAIGPNVPAISGIAVDAYHHRDGIKKFSSSASSSISRSSPSLPPRPTASFTCSSALLMGSSRPGSFMAKEGDRVALSAAASYRWQVAR